jgi:hypothetical protein
VNPAEALEALGKDVSSMIQASIGPCRTIEGTTSSRTFANIRSSDHVALATKCKSFWCCADTWAGAVTAAIGSTLRRPSVASSPEQ